MSSNSTYRVGRPRFRGSVWWWRLGTLAVTVGFLIIWEALPRLGLVSDIILPPFSEVAMAFVALVTGPTFFGHLQITMIEILAGFAIGTAVGFVLGVVLAVSEAFKRITYPLVIAFQSVPKIVLAPLIITWFGYGVESKVAMAVVISFFPVLVNTMVGLESVPESGIRLMRSLRASRRQRFWKLSLPHAAPLIAAGVKTGLTFAVVGAIVAEFIGASEGLGFLIHQYSFQLRIDRVFAVIVVMSAIGSGLYFILDVVDNRLIFWKNSEIP
jgi:NitT/TauT family transport system permease protein